ncbi:MAG: sugar-binding protein [Sedimentisphaeraceae bacterium JB056]
MKHISFKIMTVLVLASLCLGVNYNIPIATDAPTIDGDISSQWADAYSFSIVYPDIITSPNEGSLRDFVPDNAADFSADIYMKWDFSNLYLGARVYDQSLSFLQYYPGPFNSQDVFQMCFNLLNNPDAVSQANAPIYDFAVSDANDNGPFIYKHEGELYSLPNAAIGGAILADGYTLEIAIPWSDFDGYQVSPGDVHGIGFIVVDYDSDNYETTMFDYGLNGVTGIGTVSGWNTITLLGVDDCGLWGIAPGDVNKDCNVGLDDFALVAVDWANCTDPVDANCSNLN